jgi:transcription antitermination factor NusG
VVRDVEIENVRRAVAAIVTTGAAAGTDDVLGDDAAHFLDGDRVRVMDGPFQGVEGVVRERRGRRRLVVTIDSIGCGMAIAIDARVVTKVAATTD